MINPNKSRPTSLGTNRTFYEMACHCLEASLQNSELPLYGSFKQLQCGHLNVLPQDQNIWDWSLRRH